MVKAVKVPIVFPLSHSRFYEAEYEDQLTAKTESALRQIATEVENVSKSVIRDCTVVRSQTRNFRARCKLSIRKESDRLEWFIWEGEPSEGSGFEKGQMTIEQYPVASVQINAVMPRLLHHVKAIGGDLRKSLCAASFLSATTGEVLVSLIYSCPLNQQGWQPAATTLRELLLADSLAAVTNVSIMGRSRRVMLHVGNIFVNERLRLADGRVVSYRQPEGAFSNPNSGVSKGALNWLCATFASIQTRPLNVLELYCGNGNHTVALAPLVERIVAVELSEALCKAAEFNLEINGIRNATIVNVHAESFAWDVLRGKRYGKTEFNCVLVDPPRCGLDKVTATLVCAYENIVYISCSPEALIRDLKLIQTTAEAVGEHFELKKMAVIDHFPYTHHLEQGVYLKKRVLRRGKNTLLGIYLSQLAILLLLHFLPKASADTRIITFAAISFDTERHGVGKFDTLKNIAVDNRLRYCQFHNATTSCAIYTVQSSNPRLTKLETISAELFQSVSSGSGLRRVILYLDLDTLIIDPRITFDHTLSSDDTDVGMALDLDAPGYNTGVVFLRANSRNFAFISEAIKSMNHHGKRSDQRVINRLLSKTAPRVVIATLPRTLYNAYPVFSDERKAMWSTMRLPVGDETSSSLLVHFAGQFAGGQLENGKADPLLLLLAAEEFFLRHLSFLRRVEESSERSIPQRFVLDRQSSKVICYPVTISIAIKIVEQAKTALGLCITKAVAIFDDTERELIATKCLRQAGTSTRKLRVCTDPE
jgi:tRNA (uracil-5-)-methyltransferase